MSRNLVPRFLPFCMFSERPLKTNRWSCLLASWFILYKIVGLYFLAINIDHPVLFCCQIICRFPSHGTSIAIRTKDSSPPLYCQNKNIQNNLNQWPSLSVATENEDLFWVMYLMFSCDHPVSLFVMFPPDQYSSASRIDAV